MTKKDKLLLIRFITRTSMFIRVIDEENIVSFITGFELGKNGKCNFTLLLKNMLEKDLSIQYTASGWPGQIDRYRFKNHLNWVTAFKQISLDVLASEKATPLDSQMIDAIRTKITYLIEAITLNGSPAFDKHWTEEWEAFGAHNSNWYKKLWTPNEFKIISAITKQVKIKTFEHWQPFKPSNELFELGIHWKTL